ncbi:MAG: cell division protein ZapA [Nitrosomonas sp.]|jgi:cell division protein ZapA|uniref:cell division protein ZapA n=1 Tax=Nitrosomonas sp. TaxID=42353 RepID=UPI00271DFDB8|nr:cell division protein ZapA [Nitrosomonas sp.]MBK6958716.1 cell division protein ZapA [Nitrosomonas sp.]MDO8894458.1 cell division protein ZapA [Nitrosomonas sp.]MDO9471353.1 cell division protein ZapA [Nitrosomonas sp.]MDP1787188.1 cell division protein ZapA [Nitrosomonas sp.]MDP1933883.1 cell division protein ZapA [Nitrosomonas sp.]
MNNKPLNLDIMGREFCVTCPDEEREEIQLAAAYLDNKIQEIKAEGKVIDSDRIAIIAALRITHELLMLRNGTGFDMNEFRRRINSLKKKVDEVMIKTES